MTTIEEATRTFKALGDASRLRILASLLEAPRYGEELARRLDLSPSTVSSHLKRLEAAGLVESEREQYYAVYRPVEDALQSRLLELVPHGAREVREQEQRERAYRKKVLDSFFSGRRLRSIPVQRKKRRIVLEKLVEAFEPGQDYSEKEVSVTLAEAHDDFCTLRRELICEKLMTRSRGTYRRA